LTAIEPALPRFATRIEKGEAITIVAIGSSSTQGIGASAPALTYPSRLEAELRERFPDSAVRVLNRGHGGEDAGEELARLERDVITDQPDLVIWQVGTNAVLRRDDLGSDAAMIEEGVGRLKRTGADVVLMDLQDAPRVTARPTYVEMERLLANVAKTTRVGLFHRFEIMQHWRAAQPAGTPPMIGADGLHMTDTGYGCLAADLADALARNWWSQAEKHSGAATMAAVSGAKHHHATIAPPFP
jgi:lysophospholipase L1-like esterase